MTTPVPTVPAVEYEAPLVNPAPFGLYPAVTWTDVSTDQPLRWLGLGVRIRLHNYGGESAFGIWEVAWCADPGTETKHGTRPDQHDPFDPMVVWAFDQCDLSAPSQAEVRERAAQNLRLLEQTAVETEFSQRLLADAPAPVTAGEIVAAVGELEAALAKTNTLGVIHASAALAAPAVSFNVARPSGTALKSPMGHTWVFGGGYVDGLGDTLVATSAPLFGWRSEAMVREALDHTHNRFLAIAERAVVIGYEQAIGRGDGDGDAMNPVKRHGDSRIAGRGGRGVGYGLIMAPTRPANIPGTARRAQTS
jgi:hypothetical protein